MSLKNYIILHLYTKIEYTIILSYIYTLKLNIHYYSRSQQERAKKRLEFDNQCNRIYNQLDFEKQRDTESMYHLNILCKILYIINLSIFTH